MSNKNILKFLKKRKYEYKNMKLTKFYSIDKLSTINGKFMFKPRTRYQRKCPHTLTYFFRTRNQRDYSYGYNIPWVKHIRKN